MDAKEAQAVADRFLALQRLPPEVERFFAEDRARLIARARQDGILDDVWAAYEAEVGPLEGATDQDMRELLEVHAIQSAILGRSPEPPSRIAQLVRAPARRGRPRLSWRDRRFLARAVAEVRARARKLVSTGEAETVAAAIWLAADACAGRWSAETLFRLAQARNGRRRR